MKGNLLGVILVGIGLVSLLGNIGFLGDELFLLFVSAAFFLAYFGGKGKRSLGFLIPAMLIAGVGIFANIEPILGVMEGPVFFWTIGASFAGIHVIHKANGGRFKSTAWAMYLGLGLAAFGVFVLTVEVMSFEPLARLIKFIWPLALIAGGLLLIKRHKTIEKEPF